MMKVRKRLDIILHPGVSLGERAANAGFWAFLRSLTVRLLRTGRAFLLARLVAPEDWGLMGIALLVVDMVTRFSQTGVNAAPIQKQGNLTDEDYNTAWTVEMVRGLILASVAVVAAPLAGSFFHNAEATNLLRVMGIGLLVKGLTNTAVVEFDRQLEFQRRFVYRTLPHLVEAAVTIGLALVLRNAWALVFGWLCYQITFTVSSYLVHPHRPRWRLDWVEARKLLRYGKWIFGITLLQYGLLHLDDIVVARVAGLASLGFYQMAFTLSQLAATEITNVTSTVAFPAYASLQGQPERLGRAYMRTIQFVAFFSFPFTAGIWFMGPEFVDTILGERWRPLLAVLGALLLWGLLRAIVGAAEALLNGIGKPAYVTRSKALQLGLLAALIYPLTSWWGIEGAAWATVIAATSSVWLVVLAGRYSGNSWTDYLRVLGFPIVNTGLMLGVLFGAAAWNSMPTGGWKLAWAPLLGAAVYFGGSLFAKRRFGYGREGLIAGGPRPKVEAVHDG
jgi:lipopolysaccharide exporter